MNTIATILETNSSVDSSEQALRDLIDIEVVLVGGGDIPSNGY